MFKFHKQTGASLDGARFTPVTPHDSDETLRGRVDQLTGDEVEIYKWLREFYSERWIAETLMLKWREAKGKIRCVYLKLGVKNKRALMRMYGQLERPRRVPVDTEAIDSYIDARTEKEIQNDLNETGEGGNEDG